MSETTCSGGYGLWMSVRGQFSDNESAVRNKISRRGLEL